MQNAKLIFQQLGLKSTVPRLEVTAVLARNQHPLTHQDVLKQLPDNFDRVTLYRVLDWLLQNKVIHRIAGEDRAWRFQLNLNDIKTTESINSSYSKSRLQTKNKMFEQHSHAHFQCGSCGKVFCLDDVYPKLSNDLPKDFIVKSIELSIKGKCANCK